MFTIDTSVWINGDSPTEKNYAYSRAFLDRVAKERSKVIVPTLLRVEIAGTISRLSGDPAKGQLFAQVIFDLPYVDWVPLDGNLAEISARFAASHRLRGADAVYAAVASEFKCKLVSLDNEHLTRLASVIEVFSPEQVLAQMTTTP